MDFQLISPHHLKVTLDREDIHELQFCCEGIHQDAHSRDVLIELLDRGRAQTGFHPNRAKLVVEVLPHEDGGCVISFNALQGGYLPFRQKGMRPVIFEFENADSLIEGAAKAFARYSHRIYKSSLYLFDSRYRMIVYPLDYSDRLSIYFLSEYAENLGEDEVLAAYTEEHGRELIRDTALDTLSLYFGDESRQDALWEEQP